jgi:hypothetical protein
MANNVAATAGVGTTFKTTDTAGVHTGHVNVDNIAAGANVIGKVGIDQTTPGTTNAVVIVDSSGTEVGAISAIADDAAFTAGSELLPVGFVCDSTSTDVVDEGDIGAARITTDRKLIVQPYGDPANAVSGKTAQMTGTTSTAVTGVGAAGNGLYNYITAVVISNAHATVGTEVNLQDGNGGTAFGPTFPAAPAYGGAILALSTPLKQPTANTALYAVNLTTGSAVTVSIVGYKGP